MNILLIGPPGVGKGTQALFLTKNFSFSYLTTGDLLRKEVKSGSELGGNLKDIMSQGLLVSDEIVDNLVKNSLDALGSQVLFDGYPRTLNQAIKLSEFLEEKKSSLDLVINMVLDDEILIKRISGRFVCSGCSAVYNRYYVLPKQEGVCDKCGSHDFITRHDDNYDVIKKRLEIFHRENEEILKYYKQQSLLVDIQCDGSVEDISNEIAVVIEKNMVSSNNISVKN